MDASLFLLIPAILTNVWYWQAVVPGLSAIRPGILSVFAAAVAFGASGRSARHLFSDSATQPVRLTLLIGALAVIGGPFAIVRGAAVDFLIYTFLPSITLTFLVAARVKSFYALRVVLDALVLGGLLYASVFLNAPKDSWGKPYGMPYYDANDGAIVALCCLALAIGRLAVARSWLGRSGYACVALVYLVVIIQSSSRGAFVSLVATFVIILLTVRSVPVRWRVTSIGAGVVVVLALGSSSYWGLMKTLLEPEKDYNWAGNSETGRIELWRRGFGYMLEDPILGAGAQNYINKEGRSELARQAELEGRGMPWYVAHNAYVAIGVELGFPGLICFVAILTTAMRNLRRAAATMTVSISMRRLLDFQFAALCGFCAASVFISSQYWTFLYVLVALTAGTVAVALGEGTRPRHTLSGHTGQQKLRQRPRRQSYPRPVPGGAR